MINFQPNWTSSPGNTINDILKNRSIEVPVFAKKIDESTDLVIKLIEGSIKINNELASKLSNELGTSRSFWINREEHYRSLLKVNQPKVMSNWISSLPIKDMIKFGWIKDSNNLEKECLNYFGVSDVYAWYTKYTNTNTLSFRKTETYKSDLASIFSWIRRGELLSNKYPLNEWNKQKFLDSLDEIKTLTREKNPKKFLPKLISICSDCGVVLAIVPTPKNCPVSGVVKFIGNRALIQMSFRYLSDDQFWFTFFHEAGHLILHNPENPILEIDKKVIDEKEKEANDFAQEVLIPYYLKEEMMKIRGNKKKIVGFSIKAGVSPGIVIGQLQHLKIIRFEYLNGYKRRYDWSDINETLESLKLS
ncbi:ImmA/IrrE family metallo-endopeptidase [Lacinutrix sp. WUR7]|uniref:ImmA/IrrE family metallo-endopeptidase n=1 Tax=Lacinutrix sp. WUR7 TaxID=2653681 RepID=UPI00193D64E0|nr:ImmA/IrrE family metallo-endopeptidase [Lacinutrix sp. WUR7]QRM89049.1 ImmA/IrrE family metallo-endopeptidase [Lacinutrix sp. WUR7]